MLAPWGRAIAAPAWQMRKPWHRKWEQLVQEYTVHSANTTFFWSKVLTVLGQAQGLPSRGLTLPCSRDLAEGANPAPFPFFGPPDGSVDPGKRNGWSPFLPTSLLTWRGPAMPRQGMSWYHQGSRESQGRISCKVLIHWPALSQPHTTTSSAHEWVQGSLQTSQDIPGG